MSIVPGGGRCASWNEVRFAPFISGNRLSSAVSFCKADERKPALLKGSGAGPVRCDRRRVIRSHFLVLISALFVALLGPARVEIYAQLGPPREARESFSGLVGVSRCKAKEKLCEQQGG